MRGFRQFWPLYLIYAIEVVVFAIALLFVVIAKLAPVLGYGNAPDAKAVLDISSMHLVLAAPAVIGFFFRYYFIRGLWVAYAWLQAYAFSCAEAITNAQWTEVVTVFSHPVVVTAVLLFSTAGRTYFNRSFERDPLEDSEEEAHYERPAEAMLRKRLHGREAKQPPKSRYHYRLMQISLIGGAMVIWGWILEMFVVSSFGFIVILVGFILHRKSAGNRKLFLFRSDADPG